MAFLRYLSRNVTLLNILILAVLAATIMFVITPLFRMTMKFSLPQVKTKAIEGEATPAEKVQTALSPADYLVIGENNLFHPDRRIPPEKTEEKQLPKPELVLYGTIISKDVSVAYVEDKKAPKSSQGRGDRQQAAKKGDVFSGFVLREIAPDRITLVRADEVMVVYLTSEGKRKGTAPAGRPAGQPGAPPVNQPPRGPTPGSTPGALPPPRQLAPGSQPGALAAPAPVTPPDARPASRGTLRNWRGATQ